MKIEASIIVSGVTLSQLIRLGCEQIIVIRFDSEKQLFDIRLEDSFSVREENITNIKEAWKIIQHCSSKASEVRVDERLSSIDPSIFYRSVKILNLNSRAGNCLENGKIERIGDLVSRTEQQMLKIKNLGQVALRDIKNALEKIGLSLGMDIPGYPDQNLLNVLE